MRSQIEILHQYKIAMTLDFFSKTKFSKQLYSFSMEIDNPETADHLDIEYAMRFINHAS